MKNIYVVCPRCGGYTVFKNYFDWILHTPFHWFGSRRTRCKDCGKPSYMKRADI